MRRYLVPLGSLAAAFIVVTGITSWIGVKYAYEPSADNVLNRYRPSPEAYNLWDRTFTEEQAAQMLQTDEGRAQLSPKNGAVRVDDSVLRLGRKAFYKETFGNEIFLSDIVGILNGPLRVTNVLKAVLALKGKATTNLRVEVPDNVRIGSHLFQKGSYFDTGLDVPRGAVMPLGMSMSISGWKVRAGITCAACHATVDPQSGSVIEGAPNQDLNAGLLLALGTNSAAFFMHTDVVPLRDIQPANGNFVTASDGARERLPNIPALEQAVDSELLMWPRGNFDSLTDMKADPTQNPISFSWGNQPYGWSGNFMAGPFRGLTAQNNNVHALNSDSLLLADASPTLFGIDKEVYLAILLQNAANGRFRYNSSDARRPSEFLAAVKPNFAGPGVNEVVLPPTYPKGTVLSPDGTLTSSPGYRFWEQNNAMAAWQNTLVPPAVRIDVPPEVKARGRQAFEKAGCPACHSGPFMTTNRVIATSEIGVNPTRGKALQKTEDSFTEPVIFTFDTPVPLPPRPQTLPVPLSGVSPEQLDLAWAHQGSGGGYKIPTLVGLYWSAPYLHDGGVAAGKTAESELGIPGTVQRNVLPDPANSLKALIDRDLRAKVVAANEASPELHRMNVQGTGHNYWVDGQSAFTPDEQQALILYLLTYEPGQ